MRNLIAFFLRFQLTLYFLVLETMAFTLIVTMNDPHRTRFLGFTSGVAGSFYESLNNITEYFELKRINQELAIENARLQTVNKNAFIKLYGEFVTINDTLHKQQYKYLGAKVVNSTVNRRNNFLILDRGSEQGIEPEMGVLSANGIAGVVRDVSSNYSSVTSLLHINTKISAKLEKNDYHGILQWDGKDPEYAQLTNIPRHVELVKGDLIITRGSSSIFPSAIDLGTISEFSVIPGSNFYSITVKLSTNFRNVSYVYLIKNLMKDEQRQLEALFKEQDD